MSLGFPTNPSTGTTYTVGNNTYIWNGVAWAIYSQSQTDNTLTAQTIVINNTSTINGAQIITTATLNQYITQGFTNFIGGTDTQVSIYGTTVTIWDSSTLESVTLRGATTDQALSLTNGTNATSLYTGALVVEGGVAIQQDLWLGGTLYYSGHNVLTTASFYEVLQSGPDILVTTTVAGGVVNISDVSTLQSVTTRGSFTNQVIHITNSTPSTATNNGALIVSGGVGIGGNLNVGGNVLQLGPTYYSSNQVTLNGTTQAVIDTFSAVTFRSAKYIIQIESGTGYGMYFQVIEVLLLIDNVGNVYSTEYAILTSNGELGSFSAGVSVGNLVSLYFTPTYNQQTVIKLSRTTIAF